MNQIYLNRIFRFIIVVVLIAIGGAALIYLSSITYPFILAIILAFLINPLVDFLQKKIYLPRSISVLVSLLLIFSICAAFITLLITEMISGANYLAKIIPDQIKVFIIIIENFFENIFLPIYNKLSSLFNHLDINQQKTIIHHIQHISTTIPAAVSHFTQSFLENIPSIIRWFPNTITTMIFSIMATFFISKDWYRIEKITNKVLPHKLSRGGKWVIQDLKRALVGFITAQFTLISITTCTILIGLLVMKVKYSITIAAICGLIDIIPYLGTGIIFIPWIIYEFMMENTHLAIGLSVLYLVIIVQRQIIEPKVLSSSIGIDPLATLIALFIGYKWFGFLGLMIGPIVLVIINTLYQAKVFHKIWLYIIGE